MRTPVVLALVAVAAAARATAAQPAAADPPPDWKPTEGTLRAGWMVGVIASGDGGGGFNAPFVEAEGELRGKRVGGAFAIGLGMMMADGSDPVRFLTLAARLRFHVGRAFFGPGVTLWAPLGTNGGGGIPLVELHVGYTFGSASQTAPQLFVSVAALAIDQAAIATASAGIGMRF